MIKFFDGRKRAVSLNEFKMFSVSSIDDLEKIYSDSNNYGISCLISINKDIMVDGKKLTQYSKIFVPVVINGDCIGFTGYPDGTRFGLFCRIRVGQEILFRVQFY